MILYNSFHHESALGVKATYFSKTYLPTIMTAIVSVPRPSRSEIYYAL